MREATFEYQDLIKLEKWVTSVVDDPKLPCEAVLKKMYSLREKYFLAAHAKFKVMTIRNLKFVSS